MSDKKIEIRKAEERDVPLILHFIQELATYERLRDECIATEAKLRATLFGTHPAAEVIFASLDGKEVGFALFFHNYSTFLARRGLFLEDLFVLPEARSNGVGYSLLAALARIAVERDCGRLEWNVLTWNQLAIDFYTRLGATPMEEWRTFRLTGDPLQALARH
jgi:GNAT superfamily N-acetyltransferase